MIYYNQLLNLVTNILDEPIRYPGAGYSDIDAGGGKCGEHGDAGGHQKQSTH